MSRCSSLSFCFFFNDTATTEIYTLSLHDALPISELRIFHHARITGHKLTADDREDRKSTRLNSSHYNISYAVFCLKKKKALHFPARRPPHRSRRCRTSSLIRPNSLTAPPGNVPIGTEHFFLSVSEPAEFRTLPLPDALPV